jgi:hypothetical protein
MNKKIISTAAMLGLLRYARFSADPTAPVLTLDVVPNGEPGVLEVFFRKQLLAKAQVTVYAENGWEQNKRSDEQGQVRVSTPWPGRLSGSTPTVKQEAENAAGANTTYSNVGTSAVFRLLTLFTVIVALCAGGMVYGQDELGTRQETQGTTTREPTTTPLAQAPPVEPKTFKIAP